MKLDQRDEFYLAQTCIDAYIQECPEGWVSFCESMKMKRRTLTDSKFATWQEQHKSGDSRHLAKFPNDQKGNNLLTIILKFIPDLIDNEDKFYRFLKKYPMFRVPEHV